MKGEGKGGEENNKPVARKTELLPYCFRFVIFITVVLRTTGNMPGILVLYSRSIVPWVLL